MRLILYCLSLIFCMFPYTQIIDLNSYTQPYALIFSILAAAAAFKTLKENFPVTDAIALASLLFLGIFGFFISCMPRPDLQEVKYLLIYVSPIFFAFASFGIALEHPKVADRIITGAALAWMAVGLVQTIIDPTFASQFVGDFSDAAEVVVDSGRGTLGLAPEPTHFGFHMIILASALVLVGGRNWLSIACLVTALLIARSSSAILALTVGALLYLLLFGGKSRFLLLLIFPAYFLLGALLEFHILPDNIRVVALLNDFYQDPFYLLTSDTSANARLGGIYVGAKQIVDQIFFPAGMSSSAWLDLIGPIMAQNPWLLMLSDSGIPSGILIIIFQLGIFGIIPLAYILGRMLTRLRSHYETFLLCAVTVVFFSQYMISTPGFGMIYGMILARKLLAARMAKAHPQPARLAAQPRLALA